ncbi:SAM-dependent methyltransferase [Jiella sp. MQZ9-1]|uniref:SAM-dependent methyltransferase n=1 Tax=Jiella flava TaxID=2816857 RepID=A0A939G1B7_9HYPH|nr:SAM-dependent methyltransferase [Jiella flava]MBO0664030.1 SAM-dependent methyltransferase [Jiella flava]MCD2472602.1 SAM-dependent methyltransferase [Jiella flava]
MNDLHRKIAAIIRAEGPIGLDRFWNLALFDRQAGYYATQNPIGRAGDFVTAPEVSQMFGELIGAWVAAAWIGLGAPRRFRLVEIGPGRGTLMADMLRTLRRVAPGCLAAAQVHLVETSETLAAIQAETLTGFDLPILRHRSLAEIGPGPSIVVANELFDAVAIRQLVFDGEVFRQRCVALRDNGTFEFVLCRCHHTQPGANMLPHPPAAGAVIEVSPERDRLAGALAARLADQGGAGLFIDYGHAVTGYGDTLQALHDHAFADPLDRPGECDITSHVDFARLAGFFAARSLAVSPIVGQGDFLIALGLVQRAGVLGAPLDAAGRQAIEAAVARLAGTGKGQMGALFKVLAVANAPLALPPFAAAPSHAPPSGAD